MGTDELALKALVRQRHMTYEAFCREWDRTARSADELMVGRFPGHAQYYRWLRGELANGRPYPDACRMLEAMFPGWSVEALFSPYSAREPRDLDTGEAGVSGRVPARGQAPDTSKFADLTGAYLSRARFLSDTPLFEIIETASLVRASGLSLNLLTQHYPDAQIRRLVEQGTRFQLIFLDPSSEAMKIREQEEGHEPGFLARLTDMNMKIMRDRVRDHVQPDMRDRFAIGVSDDIIRFNILLIDDQMAVFQPYLPEARGVDSPTFVVETASPHAGFFHVFDQVFTSLWTRAKLL